jgi:hypothetical protein
MILNIKTCLKSAAWKDEKGDPIQLFSQAMFLAVQSPSLFLNLLSLNWI